MKSVLLTALFLVNTIFVSSQPTWLHPLYYHPSNGWGWVDFTCGIWYADNCPDGSVYFLAKYHPGLGSILHKYDWLNQNISWSVPLGSVTGATGRNFCEFVRPTADSGCITAVNRLNVGGELSTTIIKFSKLGVIEWTDSMYYPFDYVWTEDIIQNSAGNYYAVISHYNDSLFEYDNSGTIVSASLLQITGGIRRFFEVSGGDLLLQDRDSLYRRQSSGNTVWSVPVSDFELSYFTPNFVFLCDTDTVNSFSIIRKINTLNGNVNWTDTLSYGFITSITATSDDGAIISVGRVLNMNPIGLPPSTLPGYLIKLDSLGNTQWSQSYSFGEYGLSYVSELYPGFYLTGGTYNASSFWGAGGAYSPNGFITTIDSAGNGLLQNTSYMWPGDANHNDTIWASEDLLFTVLALGSTGPVRNTPPPFPGAFWWEQSSFAFDWTGQYPNGVNHKHADFDNNGVVNNVDIQQYWPPILWYPHPISYQRIQQPYSFSTLPDLLLLPEKDTVAPGEIMRFHIIAGNQALPFDSICGISFHPAYWHLNTDTSFFNAVFYNNTLGDTTANFLALSFDYPGEYLTMFCRTDHQNAYQFSDTLGYVELKANPSITSLTVFDYMSVDGYALTSSTSHVYFNFITPSVIIDPSLVNVDENISGSEITIFPNPVTYELMVYGLQLPVSLKVFDVLGNEIFSNRVTTTNYKLQTRSWKNGIYFLKISSENKSENFKFTVQH
ncbi:MAG: T9SS type A sorting domain-containing protein [Bacteroidia bacterium]